MRTTELVRNDVRIRANVANVQQKGGCLMGQDDLGSYLKQIRYQQEISQQDLAAASGLEASHIAGIELGKVQPSEETIRRLAAALNVPMIVLRARTTEGQHAMQEEAPPLGTHSGGKIIPFHGR